MEVEHLISNDEVLPKKESCYFKGASDAGIFTSLFANRFSFGKIQF
jgi:hypothetical protein